MARKKTQLPISASCDEFNNMVYPCTLEQSLKENKTMAIRNIEEHDFEDDFGSTQMFVSNRVFQPLNYFKLKKNQNIEVEEYEKAFIVFKELVDKVNEKIIYTPLINTFCGFLGMSVDKFKYYSRENSERGELFRRILDYLGENLMQNMLGNRVGALQGIFIAKANLGMRDSEAPNVNIMNVTAEPRTLTEILEEFKQNGH